MVDNKEISMKTMEIKGLTVQGVMVRTRNADEVQTETVRIGKLWNDFASQVVPRMSPDAQVYGVYYGYESDASGAFNVLAGCDKDLALDANGQAWACVNLSPGSYLVFKSRGAMPQALVTTWFEIWSYFADPQCPHQRAYTTDFEYHCETGAVDVHIALVTP
jgi:predicted transcriptional regulator YdeE